MRTFFLPPSTASNATEDREESTSEFDVDVVTHQSSTLSVSADSVKGKVVCMCARA